MFVNVGDRAGRSIPSGRLLNIQTITATGAGTYTPFSEQVKSIVIELVGGGGGGSGVAQAAASQVNFGGGGGGGGYVRKRLIANFIGSTYVVGILGAGGTAGNNSGTAGASTTFTDKFGIVYTAGGGQGGAAGGSSVPPKYAGGAVNGTATNGEINIGGSVSYFAPIGFAISITTGFSSFGGMSGLCYSFGGAGQGVISGSGAAGNNAEGYGGGGGSAVSSNNAGGAKAGGNGSSGIIIIYEYS